MPPTDGQWRQFGVILPNGSKRTYNSRIARDRSAQRWADRNGVVVALRRWDPDLPSGIRGISGQWVDDGEVSPSGAHA